ncbi:hypothetical protein PL9631_250128 [Planktothrix paucivesiculata PCC 9631]|uniref:Uncharacterized protein n=1 Tax=Planktothrix paucivesiculata PCC 9631 TaxID=671071 RepID=A0A7Z9DZ39_9CYAN|nr:hypothetical protein PL9631_250128 [Planktothrix paucivesiculata PCC 9631]
MEQQAMSKFGTSILVSKTTHFSRLGFCCSEIMGCNWIAAKIVRTFTNDFKKRQL